MTLSVNAKGLHTGYSIYMRALNMRIHSCVTNLNVPSIRFKRVKLAIMGEAALVMRRLYALVHLVGEVWWQACNRGRRMQMFSFTFLVYN